MKLICSILLLLFFIHILSAQTVTKKYTISGYLKDRQSSESLIGATVYQPSDLSGTSANQYGFYSITLPAGQISLVYSFIGYQTEMMNFNLQKDTVINVNLNTSAVQLGEVEVTASRATRIQEQSQMSTIHLPISQLKSMPAFLGEVDLMKVLQLMPGIQSGGEGSSGLYVRGGGADQNLILLDGVPVYNVSHLFGFFSVFNADALNNVEILKGGFPARYGGRVSSVLDIHMKEGNAQKFHGEGSVGLVSAKMTFEGPIWKDRTSFIVSGRRTYVDLLAAPFIALANSQTPDEKVRVGYFFYDLTAKINHKISDNDRIFLSAYMGDDKLYFKDEYKPADADYWYKDENGLKWGNITAAFRWNHIFTQKLFGNTTFTYSRYRFNIGVDSKYSDMQPDYSVDPPRYETKTMHDAIDYNSGIRDWSARVAFDYLPAPDHYIRFGGAATYHTFNPGIQSMQNDTVFSSFGNSKIYGTEFSLYAEDDIRITDRLKTNVGIHWSGFSVRDKFYHVFQPRISARYLLTEQLSVKASYSRMAQYIHLLANSNLGLPTDLWVPSTDLLKPQTSNQVALGLAQNFRDKYEISVEGYYKTMDNVLEYKEGATFFDAGNTWEGKILQGTGRGYGLEFFAQKKTGSFTGWVGYTLAWADRLFDDLNNGNRFPYKYDRRHDISIALAKRFGKKIELSGTWVFGSGNCVTIPIGLFHADNPVSGSFSDRYKDYGERNGYRMEPYHRLDASISFIKQKKWGERRWIIGVYNAYCRKNPFFIDVDQKWEPVGDDYKEKYKFVQYSLFPVIPSVSYQFKF